MPSITSFCLRCVCGLSLSSLLLFQLGSCVFCILLATSSRSIYDAMNPHQCPLISSRHSSCQRFWLRACIGVYIPGVFGHVGVRGAACCFLGNIECQLIHTSCRLTASLLTSRSVRVFPRLCYGTCGAQVVEDSIEQQRLQVLRHRLGNAPVLDSVV